MFLVFDDWELGDFDNSIPVLYGMDFGFSNDPTTLIAVAVNWKAKRVYVKQLHYGKDKGTQDVVNICKIANNHLIIADSAEPRLISDVKRYGVNIKPCIKGKDSVKKKLFKQGWGHPSADRLRRVGVDHPFARPDELSGMLDVVAKDSLDC